MNDYKQATTSSLLLGIWSHLSRRRRIQLGLLLLVILASSLAELVSLGAVLPFLSVLTDPEWLWRQPKVQNLVTLVGFTQATQLLMPTTLAFTAAAIVAGSIRLVNLWLNGRLAAAVGSDLSCEAYRQILYQPYKFHLQSNSSSIITGTTTEITRTVNALMVLLQLMTAAAVAVGLLIGLLLIDWVVAAGAALLFGCLYGLIAITTLKRLRLNGQLITAAGKKQIKVLQEGLGAIRDVILDGNQHTYLEIYRQVDRPQRQLLANNEFLCSFPRYAMEALGMVSIAVIGFLMVIQKGSGGPVIPLLGALALGAQRLLPALQQIYGGWSALNGFGADMASVLNTLNHRPILTLKASKQMPLRESIRLASVDFGYGPEQTDILRDINLEIRSGERIGLIGSTGSGKSTLVDLIIGLLQPTVGKLLIDGKDIHDLNHPERLLEWRSAIAHVPQTIYLTDGSILENIAFGVPMQQIDLIRVKLACKQARILEFIENLPDGYDSFVGERGIRLSGGQLQRIGIARALYKNTKVLVLDEATSALDSETEQEVIQAIEDLNKDLTILMIAHRISTLERCDRVVRLVHGRIES